MANTANEHNRQANKDVQLWRIDVRSARPELDAHAGAVLKDIHELGLPHVQAVASSRLYLLEGNISEQQVSRIASELLADPVTERFSARPADQRPAPSANGNETELEVHLKGGVMDPVAASALAAITDMDIGAGPLGLSTARVYRLRGVKSAAELEFIARRLLSNDCIEDVYLSGFGRHDPRPNHLPVAPDRPFELRHVAIRQLDDEALKRLSRESHLFLSLEEMRTIQNHYRDQGRDPTDLELETIAQTWSEHCVHKTLKSAVQYQGAPFPRTAKDQGQRTKDQIQLSYNNLLKDTIAKATTDLIKSGRVDWCLSVFEDNAGIIIFDDDYGVAFKVETHNHPSAIEPYGGSATGIGGVIRDVLGCGLGAKPIANTDVFCVGTPDFPMDLLPKGVLHPRRVLKGITAGVRDYGNRMGIPTVNGAVAFDDRYLGNPLVFCGCVGLIPRNRIRKEPQPGDLVVVIGGRTGRDGIHGATFSSAELTDTHADEFSHAVQIGNAITEKQVTDALLRARDHERGCLYTATTDCGAGGLSSAVGEMAATLGAVIDLEKVPLKYAGLRYDEIWISEAQERMVFSVPPANWDAMAAICRAEGVEATVIGTFGNNGRLLLRYDGKTVGDIDMQFLHNGVPKTRRAATYQTPETSAVSDRRVSHGHLAAGLRAGRFATDARDSYAGSGTSPERKRGVEGSGADSSRNDDQGMVQQLFLTLSRLNTSSKEWVIRQYDHEVQGNTLIKPLTGPGNGPSDAAVIRPRPSGKSANRGIALSNGLYPSLPGTDPYWMAVASIDEAIRNIVCVGGAPARTAILDNFCWGNCEDPQVMGALVRACQACYDAAITYGTPFISGKDSLNNEFALDPADAKRLADRIPLHNNRIRIPETLLISAIGVIEDVTKCVTMDAEPQTGQDGRFFFVGLKARTWPEASIADAAALHKTVAALIQQGAILAAHDCGEEGWLTALAEMAFAGRCGMDISATVAGGAGVSPTFFDPFAPVPCGYILQAKPEHTAAIQDLVKKQSGLAVFEVARTRDDEAICWQSERIDLNALSEAWCSPLRW